MLPYHRVTVPSFDLIQDGTQKQTLDEKALLSVTKDHVHVWTQNGRLALTPALYQAAARGLDSHVTVSLYDMIPPLPSHSQNEGPAQAAIAQKRHQKRASTAIARTQTWWTTAIDESRATNHRVSAERWFPFLVDPNSSNAADLIDPQLAWMNDKSKDVEAVAWIGWQRKPRSLPLETMISKLPVGTVAVLATKSLRQVLQFASCYDGKKEIVVGSDLPTVWAQAKKALVVDTNGNNATNDQPLDADGCVCLTSHSDNVAKHVWFRDAGAIVNGCCCMTCKTHSRAYIFHLVCAKELLAEILLFVHNLHHMLELLRRIRRAERSGLALVESLLAQLPSEE